MSLSEAGPPECDDLLVLRALRYVAAAGVSEQEGDVVLRIHLEDVYHRLSTPD